jgi:hypothetical protein
LLGKIITDADQLAHGLQLSLTSRIQRVVIIVVIDMSPFTGEVILIPVLSKLKSRSIYFSIVNFLKEGIFLVYGRIDSKIARVSGSSTIATGFFCFIENFSIMSN